MKWHYFNFTLHFKGFLFDNRIMFELKICYFFTHYPIYAISIRIILRITRCASTCTWKGHIQSSEEQERWKKEEKINPRFFFFLERRAPPPLHFVYWNWILIWYRYYIGMMLYKLSTAVTITYPIPYTSIRWGINFVTQFLMIVQCFVNQITLQLMKVWIMNYKTPYIDLDFRMNILVFRSI